MSSFEVVEHDAQPYAAVVGRVTMQTIPEIADRFGEVFGWLAERGITPDGPPFFRYRVIDMSRFLVIEAGVPVPSPVEPAGEVFADVLPAGRYVTTTHVGHPDELEGVTAELLDWAADQGLAFDQHPSPDGDVWGCRLEHYESEPSVEMSRWQVRLAFRLADPA